MKNNVESLRAQERVSQEKFAKEMGVSRQTISSLENARYNPSINLAFKIARYFNCRIEDVFIYDPEND